MSDSDTSDYYTISEANKMIPELKLVFIRIQQMQYQVQSLFKELKRLGVDFIPKDEKELLLLSQSLNEDSLDIVSSLRILLKNIQEEIQSLSNRGCNIASIDQGKVCWPCRIKNKEILLSWHIGEKQIQYWLNTNDKSKIRRPIEELLEVEYDFETT
ncbi:MAG: DUF2203 family protein [Pseudomonadota bacterium]|nr:DUF2203 family protein [Pseudomonadota bacterium]MEC8977871.1 DUF2203 family protein [Pseudomonadota bacterium]